MVKEISRQKDAPAKENIKNKVKPTLFSSSPFLKIVFDNPERSIFIRKTTAVWLFQEGERVSSDRLFRVRSKQPYTSKDMKQEIYTTSEDCALPIINKLIKVGEFCVFKTDEGKLHMVYWKSTSICEVQRENSAAIQRFYSRYFQERYWCSVLMV